jgi:hypothetical protein
VRDIGRVDLIHMGYFEGIIKTFQRLQDIWEKSYDSEKFMVSGQSD